MSQIPRFHRTELLIPRSARGYGNNDFIYFEWTPSIDPSHFRVLIEDLAGRWVTLGNLKEEVPLPNTYFPEHAHLVVVGTNRRGEQVRFMNELRRGNKYGIESGTVGDHYMSRCIPQNRFH